MHKRSAVVPVTRVSEKMLKRHEFHVRSDLNLELFSSELGCRSGLGSFQNSKAGLSYWVHFTANGDRKSASLGKAYSKWVIALGNTTI